MTRFNLVPPTTETDQADLLVVWKSDPGVTKTITQSNFIKSIGNTAINGFTATSDTPNRVILSSSNSTVIDKYYNGMRVAFVSPIASNGAVQIKIGSLIYKDLFQYGTTETSILSNTGYVEAIYIGDEATGKFYQTNIFGTIGYTSEYSATGVVSGDETTTTLTLTSAIGLPKQSYYNSMMLIFESPVNSKGSVQVNVDGLGLKNLNEGTDDVIANNLYEGELIFARYDGTQFIKYRSAVTNPPLPIPDPQIDEEELPEEYSPNVTVGSGGQYASIREAINGLIHDFGDDGGNRKATITLKSGFVIREQLFFERCDYSWITLKSEATSVQLDVSYLTQAKQGYYSFLFVTNGKSINLSLNLVKTGTFAGDLQSLGIILAYSEGQITLTNSQFSGFLCLFIIRSYNTSVVNLNNCILEGVQPQLPGSYETRALMSYTGSKLNINGLSITGGFKRGLEIQGNVSGTIETLSITGTGDSNQDTAVRIRANNNIECNNLIISNYTQGIIIDSNCKLDLNNSNINNCEFSFSSDNSEVSLTSCNIENRSTSSEKTLFSAHDISFTVSNSTIKGYASQVVLFTISKGVTLTNCRVISPTDSQGLVVTNGTEATIDGGDYRTVTNQTLSTNIVATNQGTIVRLVNNPIGGTTATGDAQIING